MLNLHSSRSRSPRVRGCSREILQSHTLVYPPDRCAGRDIRLVAPSGMATAVPSAAWSCPLDADAERALAKRCGAMARSRRRGCRDGTIQAHRRRRASASSRRTTGRKTCSSTARVSAPHRVSRSFARAKRSSSRPAPVEGTASVQREASIASAGGTWPSRRHGDRRAAKEEADEPACGAEAQGGAPPARKADTGANKRVTGVEGREPPPARRAVACGGSSASGRGRGEHAGPRVPPPEF